MSSRLISRIFYGIGKSKCWNTANIYNISQRFYGTSFSRTRFLRPRLLMQAFGQVSRYGRNYLLGNACFKRAFTSKPELSKDKSSDLRRLFGLAKPEALRIAGIFI